MYRFAPYRYAPGRAYSSSMPKTQKTTLHGAGVVQEEELVELIRDPESRQTKFVRSDRYQYEIVDTFELSDGELMEPIPASNNLLAHDVILLPNGVKRYGKLDGLRSDIRTFITKYLTLPPEFLEISVHYVLLSWVYDGYNEIPYLRFQGDYGSGKTRAINVIGSLLYKPLFTSGSATISPIFHALDLFRGSLVMDEADFRFTDERADISKILNNGNQRGFPVLRSVATPQKTYDPRAFHVFGPKIIAMRRQFTDMALESRCLTIPMHTIVPDASVPISLPKKFAIEATELRNQLLWFRCAGRLSITAPGKLVSNTLSRRGNQMLLPLLAQVDDERVKTAIIDYVKNEEKVRQSARLEQVDTVVLEGLLELIKGARKTDKETFSIAIGDLRSYLMRYRQDDFERPITARWLGSILRQRFNLKTWKSNGVYRVVLPDQKALTNICDRFGLKDLSGKT